MIASVLVSVALVSVAEVSGQPARLALTPQRYAMFLAEDARPANRAGADVLLRGLHSPESEVVRQAVRALGRLEQAGYLPELRRALNDRSPAVRAEAANAIAQVAAGDADAALVILRGRFEVEQDPGVRGALCDALGRLPFAVPDTRIPVERVLAKALGGEFSSVVARLGAARGLESLVRGARGTTYKPSGETTAILGATAVGTARPGGTDENRVRLAAILALNAAGAIGATHERLVLDRDPQIRRVAIAGGLSPSASPALRAQLAFRGLGDNHPQVRYEALRLHGRHLASDDCQAEVAALVDPDPHVALQAADLLATVCPANADVSTRLLALATSLSAPAPAASSRTGWRLPARALVSLARRAPAEAARLVPVFATHTTWQVRVYAARAAAAAGVVDVLRTLATDTHASVTAAAIEGLASTARHDADDIYREALRRIDVPIVLAATRALQGTPSRQAAVDALLPVLSAVTAQQRDTSRDVRLALLERLEELGGAAQAATLAPYLSDRDPLVAERVARALSAWTGRVYNAVPAMAPRLQPTFEELAATPAGLRVTMADGRHFEMRFFLQETPVAAWRIARLAGQGYYNGLTWHRVVPNFVVQGGSPGADEFVGDGPFIRDEPSRLSHHRGTVGLSTRGRDTGDGQFYLSLVDLPRLDHEYTVIGEVTSGLDVVDTLLEGDVIVSVGSLAGRAR